MRIAAMYSLIISAKMDGVDPQAWLTGVLVRIVEHPAHRLDELLAWKWLSKSTSTSAIVAQIITIINKHQHCICGLDLMFTNIGHAIYP